MAESMSSLKDQLHAKQRELDSVGNKVLGASIGASVVKNSALGMAAGALLGREKGRKAEIEKEIAAIKAKMVDNERQVSALKTKLSQLQNTFQNNKVRAEADMRQKRNDLENQRHSAETPDAIRALDQQLSKLHNDGVAQEQQSLRTYESERAAIQREIDSLAL